MDGLLAAVTDSITYALTIGSSLRRLRIDATAQPLCIHLLHPPAELFEDLCFLIHSKCGGGGGGGEPVTTARVLATLDQAAIDRSLKKRLHELTNMFANHQGIELVLISPHTLLDKKLAATDWAQLLSPPFMKTSMNHRDG